MPLKSHKYLKYCVFEGKIQKNVFSLSKKCMDLIGYKFVLLVEIQLIRMGKLCAITMSYIFFYRKTKSIVFTIL